MRTTCRRTAAAASASAVGCAGTRAYISLFLCWYYTLYIDVRGSNAYGTPLFSLFLPCCSILFSLVLSFSLSFLIFVRTFAVPPLLSLFLLILSFFPSYLPVSFVHFSWFFFLTLQTATSQHSNPVFNIPSSKRVFSLYWGLMDHRLPFNTIQSEDL